MLQTIGEKVLLKQIEKEDEKIGNFYVPETAKKPTFYATVVAVGEKVKDYVQVNDTVIYDRSKTIKISVDSEDYLITYASQLIAIVE